MYNQKVKKVKNESELKALLPSDMVAFDNKLARSAHGLSLQQKRIISVCLSKIQFSKEHDTTQPLAVLIRATELTEYFSIPLTESYSLLKNGVDGLINSQIKIIDKDNNRVTKINWLCQYTHSDNEGWAEVIFNPTLMPFLTGLKASFTMYNLESFKNIKSIYTWRLAELINMFKSTGFLTMSVSEFLHAINAPEAYAKDFGAVSRRVIQPAVKELKAAGLTVSCELIKTGRKVTQLKFKYKKEIKPEIEAIPMSPNQKVLIGLNMLRSAHEQGATIDPSLLKAVHQSSENQKERKKLAVRLDREKVNTQYLDSQVRIN
jgi:plasmid replication initiation protein